MAESHAERGSGGGLHRHAWPILAVAVPASHHDVPHMRWIGVAASCLGPGATIVVLA